MIDTSDCEKCNGRGWRNVGGTFETHLCVLEQRVEAPAEHHSTEAVKRLIIGAMVNHDNGIGMASSARIAADQIIDLLVPNSNHKHMPIPCTCLTELQDDAYSPGGPLSGHRKPICLLHPRQTERRPKNCTNRLAAEGKAHPKSGCMACQDRLLHGCPYEQRGNHGA